MLSNWISDRLDSDPTVAVHRVRRVRMVVIAVVAFVLGVAVGYGIPIALILRDYLKHGAGR